MTGRLRGALSWFGCGVLLAACAGGARDSSQQEFASATARTVAVEELAEVLDALAWDPVEQRFLGLSAGGTLYDLATSGAPRAVPSGLVRPSCMVVGDDGVLRVGELGSRSVVAWSPGSARREVLASAFDGTRFAAPAGLAFGADGALLVTDAADRLDDPAGVPPRGGLYRIAPGGTVTRVAGDLLQAPRGVAVAPDGRRVWVVDVGASGVLQLYGWQRAPDGKLRRPVRTWYRPAPEFGALGVLGDGPGPYALGSVVLGGSGQLLVFTPDGAPDTSLRIGGLPDGVQSARALAVGGSDGRTVAVSVAGEGGTKGLLLRIRLTDRD